MKKKFISLCESLNNSLTNHKVIWSVLIGFAVSLSCLFHTAYQDIDNNIISLILNQYYGSDNYCMHMNYFFCKFILLVNNMFPYGDGFLIVCHMVSIIANVWLSYLILARSNSFWKRLMLLMVIYIAINGYYDTDFANKNFTIIAGGFSLVGIISIWHSLKQTKNKLVYIIIGSIFIIIGSLVRFQACLLTMPFFCLHIVADYVCEKNKQSIKSFVLAMACPLIFLLGVYSINNIINTSEKYLYSFEYNQYRANMVDYPVKPIEEIHKQIPEFSQNDFDGLCIHLYGDTDRMNIGFLKELSNASKDRMGVRGAYNKTVVMLKSSNTIILGLLISLIILFMFVKIPKLRKLELICSLLGVIAISFGLSLGGRLVQRICVVLYLSCLAEFSEIFISENLSIRDLKNKILYFTMLLVSVCCFLYTGSVSVRIATPFSTTVFARMGAELGELEKLCNNDDLYVWDTFTYNSEAIGHFAEQNKLPTQEFIDHNISHGDWIYGQKYMEEYYDRIGTHNPVRALLDRENTYYVSKDKTIMETYLRENVNPNAYAVQVDTIKGIPIWKFEVGE